MNSNRISPACMIAFAMLASAGCSPKTAPSTAAPSAETAPAPTVAGVAVAQEDERKCTNEPRTGENDKRPRCGGMDAERPVSRAYRVVGGSGDPVDQVVCDITDTFVLDGKMFGVEFSGGADGTYKFVRTPNIPGLSWKAGGRYHIEFADGEDMPGTMTTEGGGTTTAGAISRDTAGAERFTLTPVESCK
jgi:hypothetical protein